MQPLRTCIMCTLVSRLVSAHVGGCGWVGLVKCLGWPGVNEPRNVVYLRRPCAGAVPRLIPQCRDASPWFSGCCKLFLLFYLSLSRARGKQCVRKKLLICALHSCMFKRVLRPFLLLNLSCTNTKVVVLNNTEMPVERIYFCPF